MVNYPDLVRNFLENSADHFSSKVALICEGQRLTYEEIEIAANRFAHAMINRGIKRGDRFAIYLPNSIASVIGIFGALKASATFVVINPTTKLEKLISILNDNQSSGILFDSQKIELLPIVLQSCPSLKSVILAGQSTDLHALPRNPSLDVIDLETIKQSFPSHRPPISNIDLDLACLIYTSGSTGEPKGVMCDHSNITFAANSIIQYLQNVPEDIVINVLPLSFDYGLYQLLMVFKLSGTLVLERSFAYPGYILKRIEQEKVSGFPGVPTIFAILLQMNLSNYDFTNLRYLTNTAAALPTSQIQQLCKIFPRTKIYSMYGLTETKRTLYLPPEQINIRPDSVGIPIPGTEVWIEDEEKHCVAPGEVGELVVRGRHVMRGYWGDEKATAERFHPGSLPGERICYTGDLFQMDDEGYFYFCGRKDDIIKCRGEKVAPKEIENILYELEGVIEAGVIGTKDPILGEAVKAFVVSNDSTLTETAVLAHCRQKLEDFMVPQSVIFLDELPKTPTGKIDKQMLAKHTGHYFPVMTEARVK